MSSKVYLIGAGGHGAVIKEIIDANNQLVQYFIDGNINLHACLDVDVIHQEKVDLIQTTLCIVSIGDNATRKKVVLERDREYANAIHPSSNLSPSLTMGKGNVFMAGSCVNARTEIGSHCIINTNASVDHDCILEDFVHISPGVAIGGNVFVGEGAHIGIGASIKPGVKIGKWSTVGAGAVVINDVADGITVVGVPAKPIKK